MTTVDELAQWFEDQGLGTVKTSSNTGDIYRNYVPDDPSDVLCLLEEPGGEPGMTLEAGIILEKPRVKIIARAVDVDTARALAEQAWLLSGTIINMPLRVHGPRWNQVIPQQSVYGDGRGFNGWFRFAFAVNIAKQPSSVTT